MYWKDEGYLLSKNNFDENSIIVEVFTEDHGKCSAVVYGGNSRKNKKIFQIGNKILVNFKSKNQNKVGYFSVELIEAISPIYFDDKKRSISILSACSLLKILLPENQINKKIYNEYEKFISEISNLNWITLYIKWEISLIKELGFEIDLPNENTSDDEKNYIINLNNKTFNIPNFFYKNLDKKISKNEIIDALIFNKNLIIENFIIPNKIPFPLSRNILEKYFN
jgi:DNA repair protein RecO (recombination protein O)